MAQKILLVLLIMCLAFTLLKAELRGREIPSRPVKQEESSANYGWQKRWSDGTCSNYIGVIMYLMNECVASDSGSVIYTCTTGDVLNRVEFSSTDCSGTSTVQTLASTCQIPNNYTSYSYGCTYSRITGALDLMEDGWIATGIFATSSDCTSGDSPFEASGQANKVCIQNDFGQSAENIFPYKYTWASSSTCSGPTFATYQYPETCSYVINSNPALYQISFIVRSDSNDDNLSAVGGAGGLAGILVAIFAVFVGIGLFLYFGGASWIFPPSLPTPPVESPVPTATRNPISPTPDERKPSNDRL